MHDGAESAFDEAVLLTVGTGLRVVVRDAQGEARPDDSRRFPDGRPGVDRAAGLRGATAGDSTQCSFTDAYFEAVSGLTTTGATVFEGLDALPVSINFWRCQLVWLGGMGLIVLAVAILPLLGIGGRQMFKAETPGPMKDSKMTPRMAETAKGFGSSIR
jgi:trk system potassium uptake protein TrkH